MTVYAVIRNPRRLPYGSRQGKIEAKFATRDECREYIAKRNRRLKSANPGDPLLRLDLSVVEVEWDDGEEARG